jgi:hypothetical protein
MHNLLGLGLRFECHTPENVVDQMNETLVQYELLPHYESLFRVAE